MSGKERSVYLQLGADEPNFGWQAPYQNPSGSSKFLVVSKAVGARAVRI